MLHRYIVLHSVTESRSLCVFQMTAQEVRLCGLLLREHFGEVVEKVGVHLLRSGTLNLRALANETVTSLDLVTLVFFITLLFTLHIYDPSGINLHVLLVKHLTYSLILRHRWSRMNVSHVFVCVFRTCSGEEVPVCSGAAGYV